MSKVIYGGQSYECGENSVLDCLIAHGVPVPFFLPFRYLPVLSDARGQGYGTGEGKGRVEADNGCPELFHGLFVLSRTGHRGRSSRGGDGQTLGQGQQCRTSQRRYTRHQTQTFQAL